jgi:mono/diheme cytochrome c family protein
MIKNVLITPLVLSSFILAAISGVSADTSSGAALFQKYCAGCHRTPSAVPRSEGIEEIMRKPTSPVMPAFSVDRLSDDEAKIIADYIKLNKR